METSRVSHRSTRWPARILGVLLALTLAAASFRGQASVPPPNPPEPATWGITFPATNNFANNTMKFMTNLAWKQTVGRVATWISAGISWFGFGGPKAEVIENQIDTLMDKAGVKDFYTDLATRAYERATGNAVPGKNGDFSMRQVIETSNARGLRLIAAVLGADIMANEGKKPGDLANLPEKRTPGSLYVPHNWYEQIYYELKDMKVNVNWKGKNVPIGTIPIEDFINPTDPDAIKARDLVLSKMFMEYSKLLIDATANADKKPSYEQVRAAAKLMGWGIYFAQKHGAGSITITIDISQAQLVMDALQFMKGTKTWSKPGSTDLLPSWEDAQPNWPDAKFKFPLLADIKLRINCMGSADLMIDAIRNYGDGVAPLWDGVVWKFWNGRSLWTEVRKLWRRITGKPVPPPGEITTVDSRYLVIDVGSNVSMTRFTSWEKLFKAIEFDSPKQAEAVRSAFLWREPTVNAKMNAVTRTLEKYTVSVERKGTNGRVELSDAMIKTLVIETAFETLTEKIASITADLQANAELRQRAAQGSGETLTKAAKALATKLGIPYDQAKAKIEAALKETDAAKRKSALEALTDDADIRAAMERAETVHELLRETLEVRARLEAKLNEAAEAQRELRAPKK